MMELQKECSFTTPVASARQLQPPIPLSYCNLELAGKLEERKPVFKERGLWLERGLVLGCPTTQNRRGCDAEGGYWARRVLEAKGLW